MTTLVAFLRTYFIAIFAICVGLVGGIWVIQEQFNQQDPSIIPLSWNEVGLDAQNPATGPQNFPIVAQLCNPYTYPIDIDMQFAWTDQRNPYNGHAYINLANCELTVQRISALPPSTCENVSFMSHITPDHAAFGAQRTYSITAQSSAFDDSLRHEQTISVHPMYASQSITTDRISVGVARSDASLSQIDDVQFRDIQFGENIIVSPQTTLLLRTYANQNNPTLQTLQSSIYIENAHIRMPYSASEMPRTQNISRGLFWDACTWQTGQCQYATTLDVGTYVQTVAIEIIGRTGSAATIYQTHYGYQNNQYVYNSDFARSTIHFPVDDYASVDGCVLKATPTHSKATTTPRIMTTQQSSPVTTHTAVAAPDRTNSITPTNTVRSTATGTATGTATTSPSTNDEEKGGDDRPDDYVVPTATMSLLETNTPSATMRRGGDDNADNPRPTISIFTMTPSTVSMTPILPSATAIPTNTPVPATMTAIPTNTPVPATVTAIPTNTPVPATMTAIPTATLNPDDAVPTHTRIPPTQTRNPDDAPPTATRVP